MSDDFLNQTIRDAIRDIVDAAFGGINRNSSKFAKDLEDVVSKVTEEALVQAEVTNWSDPRIDDAWTRSAAEAEAATIDHGKLGKALDGILAGKDQTAILELYDYAVGKQDLARRVLQKITDPKALSSAPRSIANAYRGTSEGENPEDMKKPEPPPLPAGGKPAAPGGPAPLPPSPSPEKGMPPGPPSDLKKPLVPEGFAQGGTPPEPKRKPKPTPGVVPPLEADEFGK